jgi:asparagine synthase (glutamine-hydrolysing)
MLSGREAFPGLEFSRKKAGVKMSGIAGMAKARQEKKVGLMLDRIAHRGRAGRAVKSFKGGTLGIVWTKSQERAAADLLENRRVADAADEGHFAGAEIREGRIILFRDSLGAAPLYYGEMKDGTLCFASEVKACLLHTGIIHEFPPGCRQAAGFPAETPFKLQKPEDMVAGASPELIAKKLLLLLASAVERWTGKEDMGAWLSGGLDSSAICALARPCAARLHTFAGGLRGAPDLEYAHVAASHIHSEHHELVLSPKDLIKALPEVIGALESFDALLVRSSIVNYLLGRMAAGYVREIFSGEGGDELFAGYQYLKSIPPDLLTDELIDITGRLHNTAFQRVDRCASAHGLVVHLPFADPSVSQYALGIPAGLKLRRGVEKWILRRAMEGLLPDAVLWRTKAKFWEGAGVGDLMAHQAEEKISDADFRRERFLPDGAQIYSKEELLYYRIFREHFKSVENLSWMGRTKGGGR